MTRKNKNSQTIVASKATVADRPIAFSWTRTALILGCVLILGLVIYSNTWKVPFVFDDNPIIEENTSLRDLTLTTLPKIWILNVKTRFLPFLSLAVNWALGGKQVTGYHIFNFSVHMLNATLVFFLMSLILVTPKMRGIYSQKAALYLATFSALIFMAHPLQTQAVTYIVQRMTSMAAFFYLGAIVLYLKARFGSGGLYYGAALGMAVGAMFCKENAATLPFAILMVEFIFFDQKDGKVKTLIRLVPFFATLIIIPYFVHSDIAYQGFNQHGLIPLETKALPRGKYFLTQLNVLGTYLRLFLFPVNQNLDYDYPVAHSLTELKTFASALMLLGLGGTGVVFLKRNRLVSFAIFWFFLTLSVESSIMPIRDVIFEQRMYLPLAGMVVLLAMGLLYFFEQLSYAVIACVVVTLVFSSMTYARNNVWRSEATLWEDAIRKSPEKARPYNNLGTTYVERGRHKEARALFEKAIQKDPRYASAYFNLASSCDALGDLGKAEEFYKKSLELDPEYLSPYNNLGIIYGNRGEYQKAIEILEKALKISPQFVVAYDNLGVYYDRMGDVAKGITYFEKAIKTNPYFVPALIHLGQVLAHQKAGRLDEAVNTFEKAINLAPNDPEPVLELGKVYLRKGEKEKVEGQIRRLEEMHFPKLAQELKALLAQGPEFLDTGLPMKKFRVVGSKLEGTGEMSEEDKELMNILETAKIVEDGRRIQAIRNLPKAIPPVFPVTGFGGPAFVKEKLQKAGAEKKA